MTPAQALGVLDRWLEEDAQRRYIVAHSYTDNCYVCVLGEPNSSEDDGPIEAVKKYLGKTPALARHAAATALTEKAKS
jgi:hypothetical protein